jgi:hypothetical protein
MNLTSQVFPDLEQVKKRMLIYMTGLEHAAIGSLKIRSFQRDQTP